MNYKLLRPEKIVKMQIIRRQCDIKKKQGAIMQMILHRIQFENQSLAVQAICEITG